MTTAELIQILATYPAEMEVIMAKDEEGNAFSPLLEITAEWYAAVNTWSGEILDPWDRDDEDESVLSVILWPSV
jgi:hypothetical protein